MKKIVLKKMVLNNFMGFREFELDFSEETEIAGYNGTGKSTIYTAFLWCLFGKNHRDEKDFSIKNWKDITLNRQDHVVELYLEVNDVPIKLTRLYKEVWTKKRGSESAEFSGNETNFFVDDVPYKANEYKSKVESIVGEDIFKLITNVHSFNEADWIYRRKILCEIANIKSDAELAQTNPDWQKLLSAISGKDFEQYKKQLNERKKKLSEQLEEMPIKISEASKSKQDVNVLQDKMRLEQIKKEIADLNKSKESITLSNKEVYDKINDEQKALLELKNKLAALVAQRTNTKDEGKAVLQGEINSLESKIKIQKNAIADLEKEVSDKTGRIDRINAVNIELRKEFSELNAKEAPEMSLAEMTCPSCNRRLDDDKIQELENTQKTIVESFNNNKRKRLDEINASGLSNKNEIELNEKAILEIKLKIESANQELLKIETELEVKQNGLSEYQENKTTEPTDEEKELELKIQLFVFTPEPKVDFSELDSKINKLQAENDACVASISIDESNKKIDARIAEYIEQEAAISKEIASVEKTEFVMESFVKNKMEYVEKAVNDLFKYTTVKMFEKQVNGAEKEVCTMLYDKVPYQTVNTAGRINMGIDIINVLAKHFGVIAPIFVDNSESIIDIIETDAQLVKLRATKDLKLIITHNKKQLQYV